jgi:hypothetical protein
MKNKKHPPEDHPKPDQERLVTGDIKVHGAVQVFEAQEAVEQRNAERKADDTYKVATKDFEKSYLRLSRLTIGITFVYLAATLAIFWESKRSADAAQVAANASSSQAKTADASLKIGERPYLWVPGMTTKTPFPSTERVEFEIAVSNYGRTPAMDVHPSFYVYINDVRMTLLREDKGQGIVGPGTTVTFPFRVTPDNAQAPKDVESGKTKFSIRGTVTYTDVFQESHTTEVCNFYNPEFKAFKFCDSGNEIH